MVKKKQYRFCFLIIVADIAKVSSFTPKTWGIYDVIIFVQALRLWSYWSEPPSSFDFIVMTILKLFMKNLSFFIS